MPVDASVDRERAQRLQQRRRRAYPPMVDSEGWAEYTAELRERLHSVEQQILRGTRTWDEYRDLCGERRGLMYALRVPDSYRQAEEAR